MKSSPHSLQLEKALTQQWRPNAAKINEFSQFSSVAQSCLNVCDPHEPLRTRPPCPSPTPGVYWNPRPFSQWCHPTISSSVVSFSSNAFNLSQRQGLFQSVSSSRQVAKVLEFQLQHQSFQWIFRTDFLKDGLVGSPCSPRDSQESSPTPQFKSIYSLVLSFLYSPNSHIDTWLLEKPQLWLDGSLLAK